MFGKLKSMGNLAKAGQIIEEVIVKMSPFGTDFDVKALARRLTAIAYSSRPELFEGKIGYLPNPIVVAAVALAQGLSERPAGYNEDIDAPMFLALGNLLMSAQAHSQTYRFKGFDIPMLKVAEKAYWEHEAKTRDDVDKMVGSLGL